MTRIQSDPTRSKEDKSSRSRSMSRMGAIVGDGGDKGGVTTGEPESGDEEADPPEESIARIAIWLYADVLWFGYEAP